MSDLIQIIADSNPTQFINAANLTRPELLYLDEHGELIHFAMPQSFVVIPIEDAPAELHGVAMVAVTDADA